MPVRAAIMQSVEKDYSKFEGKFEKGPSIPEEGEPFEKLGFLISTARDQGRKVGADTRETFEQAARRRDAQRARQLTSTRIVAGRSVVQPWKNVVLSVSSGTATPSTSAVQEPPIA